MNNCKDLDEKEGSGPEIGGNEKEGGEKRRKVGICNMLCYLEEKK